MHLTYNNSENTVHISKGAFHLNFAESFEFNKMIIEQKQNDLIGKKVLFMTGGVGRLANFAASLGINSYSLDINSQYAEICRNNYPEVTPIVGDMLRPLKGFDYIFLEDAFNSTPTDFQFFQTVNHWQKAGKILPWFLTVQPISFSCSLLDEYFSSVEAEALDDINDYFNSGSMELWTRLEELDGYITHTKFLDLRTQITHLKFQKDDSFNYFGFICNITRSTDKSYLRIKLKNNGVDQKIFKFNPWLFRCDSV